MSTIAEVRIPGIRTDYTAGSDGFLRRNGKLIMSSIGNRGYRIASVTDYRGKRLTNSLHVWIALAFLGLRQAGMQVNHKNKNRLDNRPSNLEYLTPSRNQRHSYDAGRTILRGEDAGYAKLTAQDVRSIRTSTDTNKALAAKHGISASNIGLIRRGRTWRSIL